jgi:hypothetical protein
MIMTIRPILLIAALLCLAVPSRAQTAAPLTLEAKIPLGAVKGRIDHLAIDLARERLLVAELGNGSLGVIDLRRRSVVTRVTGLKEPQGVAYLPRLDLVYVASAGDGSVQVYRGADFSPAGRVDLKDDADNVRVGPDDGRIYVGYGAGAIAIVDPDRGVRIADIALKAHPESFQIEPGTGRLYANLPNAEQIALIDIGAGRQIASWPLRGARANFPMALDPTNARLLVMARQPPRLIAYATRDGSPSSAMPACGDSDDLFVDAKRRRVYVSCGEGVLDVYQEKAGDYERLARLKTVSGARTALFVPERDRLYLAVRARDGEPASIWVFRP